MTIEAVAGDMVGSVHEWRNIKAKDFILFSVGCRYTDDFSSILFDRLYMLRNQLFHGGATWHGKINRAQIRDGARILQSMIPVIIHLVLENPNESWGEPCFPPLEG